MSRTSDTELRDLLLRRHMPEHAQALEERLLIEEGCAERLLEIEHDLLDDFVAGRLDAADRAAVQGLLRADPEDALRLRFARALRLAAAQAATGAGAGAAGTTVATGTPEPAGRGSGRVRLPRWLAPVGALLAAALAIVVVLPPRPSPAPAGNDEAGQGGATPSATAPASAGAPPPDVTPAPGAANTAPTTLLLLAERERGAQTRTIEMPSTKPRLRLQLELPGADRAAAVVLRDAQGRVTFESGALSASEVGPYRLIEVEVPGAALADGPTTVRLQRPMPGAAVTGETLFEWRVELRTR